MPSIVSQLYSLKNASAAEIIAQIEDIAEQRQGLAAQVRQIFGGSNGRQAVFPPAATDARAVQIALLAILVDEMSYAPSAPQRHDQIKEVETACSRLNVSYEDVLRCSRRAAELAKVFDSE
jgi:hypothetical protein